MTAIIFGANGQDGFYLAKLLKENNCRVIGVSRSGDFLRTDIRDFNAVADLIRETKPDFVFHFAANSTTRHDTLFENHETIATGTLNLLEAVKLHSNHSKVFISGSGLQFVNQGLPIKETDPFEARDAYSVSRIQSVYAARYFRTLGIRAYVGYFFNHDSPLRSERHMAQKVASAARRIGKGSVEIIEIGDMSVIKEWTFAGDIANGIWLFINQDKIFEANISSGIGHSIEEWVKVCFALVGKNYTEHIRVSTGFKAEYEKLVSNATLIQSLGFKPVTNLESLAKMMVHG